MSAERIGFLDGTHGFWGSRCGPQGIDNEDGTCTVVALYQLLRKTGLYPFVNQDLRTIIDALIESGKRSCPKVPSAILEMYVGLTQEPFQGAYDVWYLFKAITMHSPALEKELQLVYCRKESMWRDQQTFTDIVSEIVNEANVLATQTGKQFMFCSIDDVTRAAFACQQLRTLITYLHAHKDRGITGGVLGIQITGRGETIGHAVTFVRCVDEFNFFNFGTPKSSTALVALSDDELTSFLAGFNPAVIVIDEISVLWEKNFFVPVVEWFYTNDGASDGYYSRNEHWTLGETSITHTSGSAPSAGKRLGNVAESRDERMNSLIKYADDSCIMWIQRDPTEWPAAAVSWYTELRHFLLAIGPAFSGPRWDVLMKDLKLDWLGFINGRISRSFQAAVRVCAETHVIEAGKGKKPSPHWFTFMRKLTYVADGPRLLKTLLSVSQDEFVAGFVFTGVIGQTKTAKLNWFKYPHMFTFGRDPPTVSQHRFSNPQELFDVVTFFSYESVLEATAFVRIGLLSTLIMNMTDESCVPGLQSLGDAFAVGSDVASLQTSILKLVGSVYGPVGSKSLSVLGNGSFGEVWATPGGRALKVFKTRSAEIHPTGLVRRPVKNLASMNASLTALQTKFPGTVANASGDGYRYTLCKYPIGDREPWRYKLTLEMERCTDVIFSNKGQRQAFAIWITDTASRLTDAGFMAPDLKLQNVGQVSDGGYRLVDLDSIEHKAYVDWDACGEWAKGSHAGTEFDASAVCEKSYLAATHPGGGQDFRWRLAVYQTKFAALVTAVFALTKLGKSQFPYQLISGRSKHLASDTFTGYSEYPLKGTNRPRLRALRDIINELLVPVPDYIAAHFNYLFRYWTPTDLTSGSDSYSLQIFLGNFCDLTV